jgi:energy-coupling factor transporter ATP-binding protein EcfA2
VHLVGVTIVASARPVRRIENPSWLALPATRGLSRPPTRTQLQLLPFQELDWENFERLCYRLAKARGDVEQWAALYGSRGQKQDGIDIYARRPDARLYSCWQSKRHKHLTPALLKAAIAEFERGAWAAKSQEFIICSSASIQETALQTEIEAQTTRLHGTNLKLTVLGQTELSAELKDKSRLVRDFFGRDWVRDFCVDNDRSHSADSLDAADIAILRVELRRLYASSFSGLDPGIMIATTGPSSSGVLSIPDRFVEPDVEIVDAGTTQGRPIQRAESSSAAASDLAQTNYSQSRTLPSRELLRRRVSTWVAEGDHTVIAGDAGFGKSTALRAFALDLLEDGSRFPAVAQRWADCTPIVIPFAFWVRIVEKDETNISLPGAVEIWFRKFDISDQLLTLMLRSLEEQKALLLVDGLDEWSNEIAARSTLALLNTYIKTKSIPAIITGRPGGLARLGALDPLWRQARLAALSDSQQRTLTTIWFGHLHRSDQHSDARDQHIKTQVGNFFTDLGQSGTLLTLSGVPLLLSGLISLYVRQVALPRSRFQAYEELIQLLLEIHPNRRAQAALDRAPRFAVLVDASLRKQTLAHLAYHKRRLGFDAGCPLGEARTIIVDYLQSLDGAGLPPRDAIAGAKELLSVDADTAGLVVEKAPEEVGFVHAAFEEMLAGLHLAGWKLQDQEEFIKRNAGNPRWTTTILAMLHTLTRPSDIDLLLRSMASSELAASADVVRQALVAEVIFGDFRCSPRLRAELTPDFFRLVTNETWFPHRETLLRLILEAAASSRSGELVRGKPHEWFPDPITFRGHVYPALKHWPKDTARELLWLGLFNDREENKHAASATIAEAFADDAGVGDRLYALCHTVADAETLCAAMEALMQGWWDFDRQKELIAAARQSAHPSLRMVGIRGRIKANLQDSDDLDEVLTMSRSARGSLATGHTLLMQTLAAGWPNDPKIIAACLIAANKHGPRTGIEHDVAKRYLLRFSQTDPDLDSKVAALIRDDEFFFTPSFEMGYMPGSYGPEVRAALDFQLDRMNVHFHNDIAHLAVMSGSDHAKQRLIAMLAVDDDWAFWPVYGLLAGWGMKDGEAAAALLSAADRPAAGAQYFAHHLPEIILDKARCREKLLDIARLEKVERLDFLIAGFARLGIPTDDAEVMAAILKHEFSARGVFDATASLISGFGAHPVIREIALKRLRELDAPWEVLVQVYAGDEEIRAILSRYLSSLPASLRGVLVSLLGRRAADDSALADRLLQYRLDSNSAVRTASAIAYYEAVAAEPIRRSAAIVQLKTDVAAIGPQMDMIRQAALAGFIALDKVSVFRDLPDWQPERKLSVDVFVLDNNRQILAYIAKYWDRLTAALDPDLLARISRHAQHEWWCWDHLAPYISESPSLRTDFLAYCSREPKVLSSRSIEALARELPRSSLLREHSLRSLANGPQDVNASPFDHHRRELVVGRIFGRQFAHEVAIREQLENHVMFRRSAAIVGLSIAWKDSPVLVAEHARFRASDGRNMGYIWPDVAYLASVVGSREDFCRFLSHLLDTCTGYLWEFLPFCIEPIVERIKSDDGVASALIQQVKSTSRGSEKASLPKLLALANRTDDELRQWCEKEFAKQSEHTSLPEFGLDVSSGDVRPVAHAILDALSPNQ